MNYDYIVLIGIDSSHDISSAKTIETIIERRTDGKTKVISILNSGLSDYRECRSVIGNCNEIFNDSGESGGRILYVLLSTTREMEIINFCEINECKCVDIINFHAILKNGQLK